MRNFLIFSSSSSLQAAQHVINNKYINDMSKKYLNKVTNVKSLKAFSILQQQ